MSSTRASLQYACSLCTRALRPSAFVSLNDAGAYCCPVCAAVFPVVRDIPRFVPDEHYASSFGLQWIRHAKAQLDSHTGKPITRSRFFMETGWPMRMEGDRILEAGCGAGRFTEVLAGTGADVYSFDLSNAVEANRANHERLPNVHIFQASIDAIPFAQGQFDRVLCL
ncbi:MAG: methyltransferase domain-containing protein, partial [bacterium]|nr:methyltransferase domain-containing protein [bacterium]